MRTASILALVAVLAVASAQVNFVVYSLVNNPGATNQINIYTGTTAGALSFYKAVNCGGNGGSAGIQSQHALVVEGNYMYSVNAGSNTMDVWSILAADPTQITLKQTVSTGGNYPVSVTANTAGSGISGTAVCVVNQGANPNIKCWQNNNDGTNLVPLGVTSLGYGGQTTPPASHTGPSQIQFAGDQYSLLVINRNVNPAPAIQSFLWDRTNGGILGAVNITITPSYIPFAMAWGNGGEDYFMLVDGNPYLEGTGGAQGWYTSDSSSQNVYQTAPGTPGWFNMTGVGAPCWIEYSSVTDRFYTGNAGSNNIAELIWDYAANIDLVVNATSASMTDLLVVEFTNSATQYAYLYGNSGGAKKIFGWSLSPATNTASSTTTSLGAGVAFNGNSQVGLAAYTVATPFTPTGTGGSTGSTGSTGSDTGSSSGSGAAHVEASPLAALAFAAFVFVARLF